MVVLISPQRGAADHIGGSLGNIHPHQTRAVATISVRVHTLGGGAVAVNAVLAVAERACAGGRVGIGERAPFVVLRKKLIIIPLG